MSRLVAMFGPCRGVARELDAPLIVGRAAEGGLQLLDEKVSREHCIIAPEGAGHTLKDLGSRNGTWLNGQRLQAQAATVLRPGDHVSVGESVLVYEPSFDALRARDGESTLVLTRTRSEAARAGGPPGPEALARAGELALRAATSPSPDAAVGLVFACAWPGNVRQLANAIERARVLKGPGDPVGPNDLPQEVVSPEVGTASPASGVQGPLSEVLRAVEREHIALALKRARGVKSAAAEAPGISRPTLGRKLEEYGIDLYA